MLWGAGRAGVRIPVGVRYSFLLQNIQTGWGQPAFYSMVTGVLSPWVREPECEGNHSPSASACVKIESSSASTPTMHFHDVQ